VALTTAAPLAPAMASRRGATGLLRDLLTLTKPKVTLLLLAFGLVAAVVAGAASGAPAGAARLAAFGLLGYLAAGGAAALNHLFDRDLDARMARTRDRPLPSGRLHPAAAVGFAATLLAISLPAAYVVLGGVVALWMATGALVYGGLYTLVLKRRTPSNIVWGGAAGSCGVLAGWATVDPGLAPGAIGLAALVFLWTPPHFWGLAIARDADYRAAGVPMLPQVRGVPTTAAHMLGYALAMTGVSLALVAMTPLGGLYLTAAIVLGGGFTWLCLRTWRTPTLRHALVAFHASGAYLALLLLAMVVDLAVG